MALPLISIATTGFRLYSVADATGVLGFDELMGAVGKLVPKIYAKAHQADQSALEEMVELARSRAPELSGRLINGIIGYVDDDICVFEASAISPDGTHADYARFVEFGHHAGGYTQVADDDYFATTGSSSFVSHETDVEPRPYFFNSAQEVFQKRGVAMDSVIDGVAAEEGW